MTKHELLVRSLEVSQSSNVAYLELIKKFADSGLEDQKMYCFTFMDCTMYQIQLLWFTFIHEKMYCFCHHVICAHRDCETIFETN